MDREKPDKADRPPGKREEKPVSLDPLEPDEALESLLKVRVRRDEPKGDSLGDLPERTED